MPTVPIKWQFWGYVTPAGNADVQDWFDDLLNDEKEDIQDQLAYLQVLPPHLWKGAEFKALGEDISEIRIARGTTKKLFRLYGTFWPKGLRFCYTLLVGKEKKTKNDRHGKRESEARIKLLRSGGASVRHFKF
jgi:hypothetical protein